ncbi:uncharacterized protein LOC117122983 [Anneissia japonica]|uniref:uncharacterized protein LOC117122983 n=1 Tax=Anneissia japonica TaxID=1529436 RepID=UPI00142575BC|nr:uncharacterized protein LOC117122983 [Anneissia japonica]XP_033124659.1 uncharacterized protein LOC117122983 [Anneissia japonica]
MRSGAGVAKIQDAVSKEWEALQWLVPYYKERVAADTFSLEEEEDNNQEDYSFDEGSETQATTILKAIESSFEDTEIDIDQDVEDFETPVQAQVSPQQPELVSKKRKVADRENIEEGSMSAHFQ